MNSKDPCYQCPDRRVTEDYNCHSHCERYANYKDGLKAINHARYEESESPTSHKSGAWINRTRWDQKK